MRIFIWLAAFFAVVSPSLTPADVYRCELESGHLSYQQIPCYHGSTPMKIESRRSGWSSLRPGEQALLDSYREKSTSEDRKPTGGTKTSEKNSESCWTRRKELVELKAKLRRGYSLKESDRLHRKRNNLNEYLRRFCS